MMSSERGNGEKQCTRRTLLKAGAGAAGGMMIPAITYAKDYPPLGNYPAGVSGDSVFVGLTCDLTGPYSAEGEDERKGFVLAIEQLNAGDARIRKISPLTKKGLLGKKVTYGVADSETKPNSAVQAASRFIHQNKAMMITGSVSSAVAIALQKVCTREKVPYLVTIGGSNDITGTNCERYGFRLAYYAYSASKGMAAVVGKELGPGRKVAYLLPDYNYGHSVYDSMKEFTSKQGWKEVIKQVHPLGVTDYSSYLINIANSGADTLVLIDYGADAVNSLKQAKLFGLLDGKMTVVAPIMSSFLGDEAGPEIMQGVYGGSAFWWTLEDTNPMAKDFVSAFLEKYKVRPHDSAYLAYLNIALWADAVERAGTFYPVEVLKSYEKEVKRHGPLGEVWFRASDHQGVMDSVILRGKKPSEMRDKSDLFEIVAVVNGAEAAAPIGFLGCKLGSYT